MTVGYDYRSLRERAVADARSEFAATPTAAGSVEVLSAWILWLRASRPESLKIPGQFFASIRENTGANPLNWCNARDLALAPNLAAELGDIGSSLSSFAAYVF